ncbi:MAG: hypothetical protein ABI591_13640 [Kofleriaceae bacterium]
MTATACSSLVDDPCVAGFHLDSGACMANDRQHTDPDAGTMVTPPDATTVTINLPSDAGVQVLTCDLPTTKCGADCVALDTDPENCGHCGRVCASGICGTGTCVGDVAGHVVVIGHDYVASDPAMDRVIANAVHLGSQSAGRAIRTGFWNGDSTLDGGVAAVARGLQQTGDIASSSTITNVDHGWLIELDAVVIEPQTGDGAAAEQAGAAAATALADFLMVGHSVIVLETTAGVSYRYLQGAGLGTLPPPVDASSMAVTVVAPGDSVATGVVTPYLAKSGSVGYPGAMHAVVADGTNNIVVIHSTY